MSTLEELKIGALTRTPFGAVELGTRPVGFRRLAKAKTSHSKGPSQQQISQVAKNTGHDGLLQTLGFYLVYPKP